MHRAIIIPCLALTALAQPSLQKQIQTIADQAHGKVSVACSLPGSPLDCDLNPHAHPPMQSVFKFPLALFVFDRIERGAFQLDQPIRFLPADLIPHAYSPLQDEHPLANVDVPLRELLRLAVSLSDNVAADVLLRRTGGPKALTDYIHSLGIPGFHAQDNEAGLHRDVAAQYRNWFEPAAAVQLLRRIADRSPISAAHTRLLLDWMEHSPRGAKRVPAGVPEGVVVAHKAGTSDVDNGLAHATNDIGLIFLPDGRALAIAVFVTDSTADDSTRDSVIAQIAKAAYTAAGQRPPQRSYERLSFSARSALPWSDGFRCDPRTLTPPERLLTNPAGRAVMKMAAFF